MYRSPQRDHHEPIPGDPEPKPAAGIGFSLRRAIRTDQIIRGALTAPGNANLSFRALSYWYAFRIRPGFAGPPIWPFLRALSRVAGYRIDQSGYAEIVLLTEVKLRPLLYFPPEIGYNPPKLVFAPARAESPPPIGRAALPLMRPSQARIARPMASQAMPGWGRRNGPTGRG